MRRDELTRYLDGLLEAGRFKDYCPNGLQVEGRADISRVVAGVTASQALVDAAVASGVDAILVHHGWFWRGEDGRIAGFRRKRLKALLTNDINLYAYHLPLDSHLELGNNAQLAQRMAWDVDGRFGEQDLGWHGRLDQAMNRVGLARRLATLLGREPLVIGDDEPERPLARVAWCSGGAQSFFEAAIDLGVDVYVSGEVSEQNVHLARESGVTYIAAGHHATERFGVEAIARHLGETFGLHCEFIDIDSPV